MQKLTIIIPTYNEEKTIEEILNKVWQKNVSGWQKEIIVIDDGSTDQSQTILGKWKKKITVLIQAKNQGKGAAISAGLRKARGEIILIQDADLEYSPDDYDVLLKPFTNPKVKVVYGSRFLGPHLSTMFIYALGNKFVTLLTNLLFNTNITDMETGYKVFRRELLSCLLPIEARRFDFEPEFTAKVLSSGEQIYEVPISYFGRKFSEGKKLTWKDGIVAVWTLLKFKWKKNY